MALSDAGLLGFGAGFGAPNPLSAAEVRASIDGAPIDPCAHLQDRLFSEARTVNQNRKWLLPSAGTFIALYGVIVLWFIATAPDVGIRVLLADREEAHLSAPGRDGVVIRQLPKLESKWPLPQPGDVLIRLGTHRTRSFLDFSQATMHLYHTEIESSGQLYAGSDPMELDAAYGLPALVKLDNGPRMVEIEFVSRETGEVSTNFLPLRSVPVGEVAVSFVWLLFQLGILILAAIAYWHRPFDDSVTLFFAMCITSLGTFVGGYHWWMIAGSLWLMAPFLICAALLPWVTLHFFLIYPRPKLAVFRNGHVAAALLYAPAVVGVLSVLGLLGYAFWSNAALENAEGLARVEQALGWLRSGIYIYLATCGAVFGLTLVTLTHSFLTTRNPVEQIQVKWILRAGLVAALAVAYAFWLALVDRERFAFGGARMPMFIASLSFMLAYAVAIVRYKLILLDEIIGKGVLYYAVSTASILMFGVLAAALGTLDQWLGLTLSRQQLLMVAAILMLSFMLLLWLRDRFQQAIDRRFFREKYQLDRALQQMNRAVGHLVDLPALAEMMLVTCRDVLDVESAALYLRSRTDGPFQLVAADGVERAILSFSPEPEFLASLEVGGSLQRVTPGTRSEMTVVQNRLRELDADLVHVLSLDEDITSMVVLGEKKNGSGYTAEDLTFLNALGQITNVALHSAKVHQEIARLNDELRVKSEKIAEQARQLAMLQVERTESTSSGIVESASGRGAGDFRRDAMKGNSPAIVRVLETVRKVASSEATVLVRGESGTGKELLAQVLHDNSPRASGPMVRVNCASLSSSLLESELFGHVKGAFTGAHRDKIGRFEAANGGTLFLDEIGDISLETQIKLLRVLQERCFEPVGSTRTIHVDVRLITATHQDLERLIAVGRFREDLFYRLNVISITLPPLRERREDIIDLSLHFLKRASSRTGKRVTHIDAEALSVLERAPWPGNIRQLENVIERAVVLADDEQIRLRDLPAELLHPGREAPQYVLETKPLLGSPQLAEIVPERTSAATAPPQHEAEERRLLEQMLLECGGNKAEAARRLGMPRSTYYSKLKKYELG